MSFDEERMTSPTILGIDIGGSGIKGAPVDLTTGALHEKRFRLATPQPATPAAVAAVVAEVVGTFNWHGLVGCAFPSVIRKGVAYSAANIDPSWIGTNVQELFTQATGCSFVILNDADAAGLAEQSFGAARDVAGVVLVLTFGTGIGSALFIDGRLVPNTELGHLEINGREAEVWASNRARKREKLNWKSWAARVDEILHRFDALLSPDLFIIGGGVSKYCPLFLPMLTIKTPVRPAQLRNQAGIIGAALVAARGGS